MHSGQDLPQTTIVKFYSSLVLTCGCFSYFVKGVELKCFWLYKMTIPAKTFSIQASAQPLCLWHHCLSLDLIKGWLINYLQWPENWLDIHHTMQTLFHFPFGLFLDSMCVPRVYLLAKRLQRTLSTFCGWYGTWLGMPINSSGTATEVCPCKYTSNIGGGGVT